MDDNKIDDFIDSLNTPAGRYEGMLSSPRKDYTYYQLEHPEYETEQDYVQIMSVWERLRSWWSREHKEICPRPKRRPGRPKDDKALKAKQEAEAAKAAKAAKKEQRSARPSDKRRFAMWLNLGLTDEIVAGLASVRGDLPFDECIRQLLVAALGPLAEARPDEKKIAG